MLVFTFPSCWWTPPPHINSYFLSWWWVSSFLSSSNFYLDQMIVILISGIVFIYDRLSCWFIHPSYVLFCPILFLCLLLSSVCSLIPIRSPLDTLIDQSIKWFWYWKLGYLGLCFYVPVRPINFSFPTVLPSYQCVYPVLLMCFFLSIHYPLL